MTRNWNEIFYGAGEMGIIVETKEFAKGMRKLILESIYNAKSGHPGGSLSCTDILAVLFNEEINISPDNTKNP